MGACASRGALIQVPNIGLPLAGQKFALKPVQTNMALLTRKGRNPCFSLQPPCKPGMGITGNPKLFQSEHYAQSYAFVSARGVVA